MYKPCDGKDGDRQRERGHMEVVAWMDGWMDGWLVKADICHGEDGGSSIGIHSATHTKRCVG